MKQYMAEELSALDAALADLEDLEGLSASSTDETLVEAKSDVVETKTEEATDDTTVETVVASAEVDAAAEEKILEEAVAEAEFETIAHETYAEAPAETVEVAPSRSEEATTEPKKPKSRAGGAVKPSEALKVRLGGIEAVQSTLIHSPEDAKLDAAELQAKIEERMAQIDSAPKKVGEKLVNAYAHLNGHAALSVYTELALEILLTKGECTSDDIFNRYLARPNSEGTSRSQSGQQMALLPLMGVAERSGKHLTLIKDSVIAMAFAEKLGIEASAE